MEHLNDDGVLEEDLNQPNTRENLYFWAVMVLGLTGFVFSCVQFPGFWRVNGFDFVMFLVLNVIAEQSYVVLQHGSKISASFAIMLSVLVLFNPPVAIIIAALGSLISVGVIQRRSWRVAWFNTAQYAVTYSVAGLAMQQVHAYIQPYLAENRLMENLLAGGAATAVYLLLNLPLVNAYVALRQNPDVSWRHLGQRLLLIQEDRVEIFQTLFFFPIAVLVAYSYQREHNPIIPVVLAFLVFGGLRFIDQRRRIERQREKMEVLYHLTKRMGESVLMDAEVEVPTGHVFDHLFTSEASSIKRLIRHDRTSVYRVERVAEEVRIVHEKSDSLREPDKVYWMSAQGVLQEVVRSKRTLRLSDLSWLDGAYTPWRIAYHALMALPLLVDDEVAFILVMFRTTGDPFHERDQELVRLMVNAFEITLKNVQLRNRIQDQAIKDGLMGVFNHRYMKVKLEDEMARSKRYDKPLTLIIADVDYFKKFNDAHGHLLGDKVLKEIALILIDSVRETDIVARYGGEELAILLPETPLEAACEVAERIRRNVAQFAFTGKEQQEVAMSLSIGVSCLDREPELTPSELIIRTDTALYRAKHQGRNQICRASMDRGRLVIETYSRGQARSAPEITTEAEAPALPATTPVGMRAELRKSWDDLLEKSLPELERNLRHELTRAGLEAPLERFFEKKILPVVPTLIQALAHSNLDASGRPERDSALTPILEQLQQVLGRRIQRREDLRLLQRLLLKTYRHFIRQSMALAASESERRELFNQGYRLMMHVQDRLFDGSLAAMQDQTAQARAQHRLTRQLLQILLQAEQPQQALQEMLRQLQSALPELQSLFLARPEGLGNQFVLQAGWPAEHLNRSDLLLQDALERLPKNEPVLLDVPVAELEAYLHFSEPLPVGGQLLLLPLWWREQWVGLVGMSVAPEAVLTAVQRLWLKNFGQELAETLWLLGELDVAQERPLLALRTLVEIVQGVQGSFRAERMASLAARLSQRLALSLAEQQDLRNAAYLLQLGDLLVPQGGSEAGQRRQAQLLNQRLLGALELESFEKYLRHVRERWDGTGFPDGLSAQRIPLFARLLGLVAAFVDQSDPVRSGEEVVEELRASGYYDPKLCQLLKDVICESNR